MEEIIGFPFLSRTEPYIFVIQDTKKSSQADLWTVK